MRFLGQLLHGFGMAGILLLATPIILLRMALLLAIGLFADREFDGLYPSPDAQAVNPKSEL